MCAQLARRKELLHRDECFACAYRKGVDVVATSLTTIAYLFPWPPISPQAAKADAKAAKKQASLARKKSKK